MRSFEQMKAIVKGAPKGFGGRPAAYRYDVIFLKDRLTADETMKRMTAKPGVCRVFAGDGTSGRRSSASAELQPLSPIATVVTCELRPTSIPRCCRRRGALQVLSRDMSIPGMGVRRRRGREDVPIGRSEARLNHSGANERSYEKSDCV